MSATQFFGLLSTLTPLSFFLFMINGTIIQSSGHTRNLVFPLDASTALPCLCHHHLLTFTSKSFEISTMKLVCSAFSPFLQPLTDIRQTIIIFSSVQFSRLVMSDSSWPHGLQYTRLPCPSPTHRASSYPLSRWGHPTISSSVSSSHQVAEVLKFQLQNQFFQWTPRTDLL